MKTTKFLNTLKGQDFESWVKVNEAYQENCINEEIMETGFNTISGYVYIALENGVQIASCFGQSVDYIVYDFETGEDHFFDEYEEAVSYLDTQL
jgi:hypothetical protein